MNNNPQYRICYVYPSMDRRFCYIHLDLLLRKQNISGIFLFLAVIKNLGYFYQLSRLRIRLIASEVVSRVLSVSGIYVEIFSYFMYYMYNGRRYLHNIYSVYPSPHIFFRPVILKLPVYARTTENPNIIRLYIEKIFQVRLNRKLCKK